MCAVYDFKLFQALPQKLLLAHTINFEKQTCECQLDACSRYTAHRHCSFTLPNCLQKAGLWCCHLKYNFKSTATYSPFTMSVPALCWSQQLQVARFGEVLGPCAWEMFGRAQHPPILKCFERDGLCKAFLKLDTFAKYKKQTKTM